MDDADATPAEHPIHVERERLALAWLNHHWCYLSRQVLSDIDARAFSSPERRAFFVGLRDFAFGGALPEIPAEILALPDRDDSSELWQVCHAGAARALRDAAERLHQAATAWLMAPADDGIASIDLAVTLAMERLAAAWGEGTRRAADLLDTITLGTSLVAPFATLQRAIGGIPVGSLVFVRGARGLAEVSPSARWALATARQGLATALWGRRLTEGRVAADLAALCARIELRELRVGALTSAEWSAIAHSQTDVAPLPLVIACGTSPLKLGRLFIHLRRWRCDGERVRVAVIDGAEHLEIAPLDLFRAARMMGRQFQHPGYLVVVGDGGSPYEGVADMVVDGADLGDE